MKAAILDSIRNECALIRLVNSVKLDCDHRQNEQIINDAVKRIEECTTMLLRPDKSYEADFWQRKWEASLPKPR